MTAAVLEADLDYPSICMIARTLSANARGHFSSGNIDDRLSARTDWRVGWQSTESTKLIPNLGKRQRYKLHYRSLKFYQQLRRPLCIAHWSFANRSECPSHIPYMFLKKAITEFEKNFFKLINNCFLWRMLIRKKMSKCSEDTDSFGISSKLWVS